jgi:DNA-binding NarL/FixJ family response regulator
MATASNAGSPVARATWLVLATDGPGLELDQVALGATRVRTVSDSATFAELLASERPRVAIVAEPPAGARELGFVREARRRRQGLRTIHLSQASNVPARLAALRDGFDEALPQSIEPAELAGRAALLEARIRSRLSTSLPIAEGFELDLVAHELRLDGRSVHLRPKEFRLLAMLAAHRVAPIPGGSCSTASGVQTRSATHEPSTSTCAGSGPRSSPNPTDRST